MSSLAPSPDADFADALRAAREHFRLEMDAVMRDIRRSLRGRDPRQLTGRECVHHLELRAKFTEIADAQRHFAGTLLARQRQRFAA